MRGLAVQYFQYGLWKSAVGYRHRHFPKRSAIPALVTAAVSTSLVLAWSGRTRVPLTALAACYATGGVIAGARSRANPLLTGAALAVVHLSYGTGVIAGAVRPQIVSSRLAATRVR